MSCNSFYKNNSDTDSRIRAKTFRAWCMTLRDIYQDRLLMFPHLPGKWQCDTSVSQSRATPAPVPVVTPPCPVVHITIMCCQLHCLARVTVATVTRHATLPHQYCCPAALIWSYPISSLCTQNTINVFSQLKIVHPRPYTELAGNITTK